MIEPISVVRYKVSIAWDRVTALDYRTITKDFKIDSVYDSTTQQNDVILTYNNPETGVMDMIPIGNQPEHALYFYRGIIENKDHHQPAIKVKKNKTDKPIDIILEHNELYIAVELDPGYTAVWYTGYVSIFNTKQVELYRYVFADDGLYQLAPSYAAFTYIDAMGDSKGTYKLDTPFNHDEFLPVLNHVIVIGRNFARFKPIASDDWSCYEFDQYGLLRGPDAKYFMYISGKKKFATSVHELIYDNFDFNLHYDDTIICTESMYENKDEDLLEYIRFVYNGDKEKDIKELKEPLNFDDICNEYFNY